MYMPYKKDYIILAKAGMVELLYLWVLQWGIIKPDEVLALSSLTE